MANSEAGMSSDVAQALEGEYQVFLSFRGLDTRHSFTDFLYRDLKDAGVCVFRDEDDLQEGEVIGDNLLHAIDNSILYIPIFSQNYASSKWCLRELEHIVKNVSKSEGKKSILPIFFNVEPEDVKLKIPPDSAALLEHEMKCPNEVKEWRKALEVVDKIKGWIVKKNQSQVVILESVVEKVVKKLDIKQKSVSENLVGLDNQLKDLIELLDVNEYDVRLIAIYGMGGIGKTTIAKVVFNRLSFHFGKSCSFLEDIRETSSTKEGIVCLQKKLLSDIAGSRIAEQVMDREQGMRKIGEVLRTKKTLVVLDDVAEEWHIKDLIINYSLRSGSRIIITTRNKTIPLDAGFNGEIRRYEVLKMDDALALQLFCRHAFAKVFPLDDYRGLSSEIVSILGGLPLAIEVVGSFLKGKKEAFWKETLAKLNEEPEGEILKKLRISYDDLDKYQKQIFLDIACLFFNKKRTDAVYMWADCSLYPEIGIDVLTSRCLIKILDNDKFWMHDQLIDLGRLIVREENQDDLGKRSRLWIANDALQIIGTEEIKHKVQALKLSTDGPPIEIRNEDFEKLPNLRFLDLKMGTYVGDFARCRSKLRWFSWSNPPQKKDHRMDKFVLDFNADNLYLDQLVVCKLDNISFKGDSQIWDIIKRAKKLKVLSITRCLGITTIPDISICSTLERLTLVECFDLKRIEIFIGDLQSLIELRIEGCSYFTDLPEEVGALVNLKHLSLSDCQRLRELPSSLGNLTSLTELDLSGTEIGKFPDFIVQLKLLQILRFPLADWMVFNHDWQLPNGISTLVKLEELNLSGHDKLKGEIPVGIGECSSLRILNLSETCICKIPRTINKLHHLQSLNLTNCNEVQELPELPTSLTCLLLCSQSLLWIPNLAEHTNLVELVLSDYSEYTGKSKLIPRCDLSWIGRLFRLKLLQLNLLNVPVPPHLTSLSQLEELVLARLDLKPLTQVLSSDWNWRNLSTLRIIHCEVQDIPLDGLSRLKSFRVRCCKGLQRLAISFELRDLRKVEVSSCSDLVEIQVMGVLKSLEELTVVCCDSLIRISGLSYLKNLYRLEIGWCHVLSNVEGLNELESVKFFLLYKCLSLRWLIDASCAKIPDDCFFKISWCGYSIKDSYQESYLFMAEKTMCWKQYREEILPNASNKISFTIQFHLGGKESWDPFRFKYDGGIEREIKIVDPDSVTYGGLIAKLKNLVFRLKRMWYWIDPVVLLEIKCDDDVKYMVQLAARRRILLLHLFVEGTINLKRQREMLVNILNKGKRQRDDDHASHNNTTTKNSTCGQQSGIPQQVTRRITRQATKKQPPLEAAALPVEATTLPVEVAGPSRKKKKNDSKQVNPIRRSARLMKGSIGGTSHIVHLD